MFTPADLLRFKAYIKSLDLADSTKANYCRYVDWIQQSVSADITAQRSISDAFIEQVAKEFNPAIRWVNDRRRSDVRSIMRHYRSYREQK